MKSFQLFVFIYKEISYEIIVVVMFIQGHSHKIVTPTESTVFRKG